MIELEKNRLGRWKAGESGNPTNPNGNKLTTAQAVGRTRYANGWAGRQAF